MKVIGILGLFLLINGCASRNYHAEYYVKNVDILQVPSPEIPKVGQDPLIVSSQNLNQDFGTLLSKGYIFLGLSKFEAQMDERYNVIQQGRDVGASVIITNNSFLGISSTTVPLLLPTTSSTYHTGSVSGYSHDSAFVGNYSGSTTTNSNQWVPMTVSTQIYQQTTAFFVKSNQQFKFGVYYRDLTTDEKRVFSRNSGVVVTTVIENSPAYMKNVLVGDVITAINDIEITNSGHAGSIINSSNLQTVSVFRKDQLVSIPFIKTSPERTISSQGK